jgi:hypothetical protein
MSKVSVNDMFNIPCDSRLFQPHGMSTDFRPWIASLHDVQAIALSYIDCYGVMQVAPREQKFAYSVKKSQFLEIRVCGGQS